MAGPHARIPAAIALAATLAMLLASVHASDGGRELLAADACAASDSPTSSYAMTFAGEASAEPSSLCFRVWTDKPCNATDRCCLTGAKKPPKFRSMVLTPASSSCASKDMQKLMRWTVGDARPKKAVVDGATITVKLSKLPTTGGLVCVQLPVNSSIRCENLEELCGTSLTCKVQLLTRPFKKDADSPRGACCKNEQIAKTVCDKPDQFWPGPPFTTCVNCTSIHPSCVRCNATAGCTECSEPYPMVSDGSCRDPYLCAPSQFYDKAAGYCRPCTLIDPDCATCVEDPIPTCKTCQWGLIMQNGTCVAPQCAPDQYLNLTDGACGNCSELAPECISCSTTPPRVCKACTPGLYPDYQTRTICVDEYGCLPDQYWDDTVGWCEYCTNIDPDCATCDEDPAPHCKTCKGGLTVQNGTCVAPQCAPGQFLSNGTCRNCAELDPECVACTSTTVPQLCRTCAPGFKPQYPAKCERECPSNQYADVFNECKPCTDFHPLCEACSALGCNKCGGGLAPVNSTGCGNYTCPAGDYLTPEGCRGCQFVLTRYCTECFLDAKKGPRCTNCELPYTLQNGTCVPPIGGCTDYEYYDPSDRLCYPCSGLDPDCLTCTKADGCTQCTAKLPVNNGTCFPEQCAPDEYLNLNTSTCDNCSNRIPHCISCASAITKCKECEEGFVPGGSYGDICEPVIPECFIGFYLAANNTCQPCTDFDLNCIQCDLQRKCFLCRPGLVPDGKGGCGLPDCKPGEYPAPSGCVSCTNFDLQCTSCTITPSGLEVCLVCQPPYTLNTFGRCANCGPDEYAGLDGCVPCTDIDPNCSKCDIGASGFAECLKCAQPYTLDEFGRCVDTTAP
ncbi:hypothetical protein Rsub_11711 [Raphidocelis subcapitata]|uniref:EGF-like domain-containing protein n=1 Tax=Raphidocelis subcapitata TaxID=307507 RepID=A0A2V0PH67_9CHLO|nr:hypothetical protein Rsub_11711 [Raphidocelis subcapitata]|eukprot:GBF98919.1 hypothetical protein Rsub_11711 [Raphidocelis subcapitata]